MSKCFSFCAAALAAVWGFVASGATTNRAETVTREGFTLVEMSYDGNPCWHAYMMKVDLDTKDLKFDIVYPDNKIGAKKVLSGMSSQLKTALDNEYGSSSADVVVGINGDFFGGDGFTQRANVRNGEQLQSGYDGNIFGWGAEGESLYETTSGEFKFGKVYFGGSVKIDGKTWAIKDVNTLQYNTSGLAVYTAKCLQKFPAAGLKIKFDAPFAAGGSITVADKKFKVVGTVAANGTASSFAADEAAIVGLGSDQASVAKLSVDTEGSLSWSFNTARNLTGNSVDDIRNLAGVWLDVLKDGVPVKSADQNEGTQYPRTCIGLSKANNQMIMFVVDGRQNGWSQRLDTAQVAQLLLAEGCEDAFQFDGGGSTDMVVEGACVNRPSDGSERTLATGMFLSVVEGYDFAHPTRKFTAAEQVLVGEDVGFEFEVEEDAEAPSVLVACWGDKDYGTALGAWPNASNVCEIAEDATEAACGRPDGWSVDNEARFLRFFLARELPTGKLVASDCTKVFEDKPIEVEIPAAPEGLEYTGDEVSCGIADTDKYEVGGDLVGTNAGTYTVTLKLKNIAKCVWAGTGGTGPKTVEWTIAKAQNEWVVEPSMDYLEWNIGTDAPELVLGEPKFGAVSSMYVPGSLPTTPGDYRFGVTVEGTDDYTPLAKDFEFSVTDHAFRLVSAGATRLLHYPTLCAAVAAAKELGGDAEILVLKPGETGGAMAIDFNCTIAATNADPYAAKVTPSGSGTSIVVKDGARVLFSNFVMDDGKAAAVKVEQGGVVAVEGLLDFSRGVEQATFQTAATNGFELAGELLLTTQFAVACDAAAAIGTVFGTVSCDQAAAEASAAKICCLFDQTGDGGAAVIDADGTLYLQWADIPADPATAPGYYVDDEGNTNCYRRLNRLFERYAEYGKDCEIRLRSGKLTIPVTVTNDLTLVGEDGAAVEIGYESGFSIAEGVSVTVSNVTFHGSEEAGYVIAKSLFLVEDEDGKLNLQDGVTLSQLRGLSYYSGAVAVLKGSATICEGAVIEDCEAYGSNSQLSKESYGGGVYVGGAGAKLTMTGGTIRNCAAKTYGGGIYVYNGGKLILSGPVTVYGNTAQEGRQDDIYIANGINDDSLLELAGALTGDGLVGLQYGFPASRNAVGGVYAKGSGLDESAERFVCTALAIDEETCEEMEELVELIGGAGGAWVPRPAGVEPCEEADAVVKVIPADGGEARFYESVSDGFESLEGDATVEIMQDAALDGDIDIRHNVILRGADPSVKLAVAAEDPYGLETVVAADLFVNVLNVALTVHEGASLAVTNLTVAGLGFNEDVPYATGIGLFKVDGGTLELGDGAVVSNIVYGTRRDAGAVTVWNGGVFRMGEGAVICDCANTFVNAGEACGVGGGLLVDNGTAYLAGGTITNCSAYRAGGVYVGNGGTAHVSGTFRASGNEVAADRAGTLALSGAFTGSVPVGAGVFGDTNVFGRVDADYFAAAAAGEVAAGAKRFTCATNDAICGVVVTNGTEALMVWNTAVSGGGNFVAEDGSVYRRYGATGLTLVAPRALENLGMTVEGETMTLSFGGAKAGYWYTLYSAASLGGPFAAEQNKQAAADGVITFTSSAEGQGKFWKVLAN